MKVKTAIENFEMPLIFVLFSGKFAKMSPEHGQIEYVISRICLPFPTPYGEESIQSPSILLFPGPIAKVH